MELVLDCGRGKVWDLVWESNISLRLDTLPDILRGGGRFDARRIGEVSLEVRPDFGVADV